MRFLLFIVMASVACAQDAQNVTVTQEPPRVAYQTINGYSGTKLVYSCTARSTVTTGPRSLLSVSISAASNASPVSLTSTGHGFDTSSLPKVTISGGTGNWTAINGTFTATVTGANTFTIPVDSTTFGALAGTITFTTTAPRTGVAEWSVLKLAYDGSGNLIGTYWLNGSPAFVSKCSDAALTTINQQ